jgi:hypothetical protein
VRPGVAVGVAVRVALLVAEANGVSVAVAVAVFVSVNVGVGLAVAVSVGINVAEGKEVRVEFGSSVKPDWVGKTEVGLLYGIIIGVLVGFIVLFGVCRLQAARNNNAEKPAILSRLGLVELILGRFCSILSIYSLYQ